MLGSRKKCSHKQYFFDNFNKYISSFFCLFGGNAHMFTIAKIDQIFGTQLFFAWLTMVNRSSSKKSGPNAPPLAAYLVDFLLLYLVIPMPNVAFSLFVNLGFLFIFPGRGRGREKVCCFCGFLWDLVVLLPHQMAFLQHAFVLLSLVTCIKTCTLIVVGRKATDDGSAMVVHTTQKSMLKKTGTPETFSTLVYWPRFMSL